MSRPCVIISGGSEIVSASLAEELVSHDVPYIVVSLGKRSILRGLRGCIFHTVLDWPPVDPSQTASELLDKLRMLGSDHGVPFPVFATEDGGLRLLLEYRELLEPVAIFGRCRNLRMGGLDKCEFFSFLESRGLSDHLVPWARVCSPVEAAEAKVRLGGEVIAKPSLKPYSMELGLGGAKLISSSSDESPLEFESHIARSWNRASEWIVQKRLEKSPKGEELLHCLRVPGHGCAVTRSVETVKYPFMGGTACVVETLDKTSHDGIGELVAEECDLFGLAEMPFLMDNDGRFRLIEINPRPWLQILLPHRAGFSMAYHAYRSMLGDAMDGAPFRQEPGKTWVNAERLILAALKRNSTVRLDRAIRSIRSAECIAMHDSKLPGLRLRWIARMLRRLFRKAS